MTLHQVSALFSVVFLLAAVITAMYGTEISGALAGAWARGSAQAAAEVRRLARARERGAAQGERARQERGARGRPERGPARRVLGALARGAFIGALAAARSAAGRRRHRASGGAGDPPGPWRQRPIGVCDQCGVTAGRASLSMTAGLLVCFLCRRKAGGSRVTAETVPSRPRPSTVTLQLTVTGRPEEPALPRLVPLVPLPGAHEPERISTVPAAGALPALETASSPVLVTAGAVTAVTGGTKMTGNAVGSRRPGSALAVQSGAASKVLEGTVAGRPGSRVAVRPQSQVAAGDTTSHGEWVRNAETVVVNLGEMFKFVQAMTEDLAAGDCPDDLITDVAGWAETIYRHGRQVLAELLQIDNGLRPWIDAVAAAGGWKNVASPRWLEGR